MNSQLMKGILEGCILAIIHESTVYGYELAAKLLAEGIEVSEGSIYPILLRLQKEGLIIGEKRKSPSGPNRKYYLLTNHGVEALKVFKENWSHLSQSVEEILKGGDEDA